MIPDGYPYKVGYRWTPPYRFQRITQVLEQAQSGEKLDVAAMQQLQSDVLSLPALRLIDLLRAAAVLQESTAATQLLLGWNGELKRDSSAAALYEVWLPILTRETMNLGAVPEEVRTMLEDWSPHQVLGLLENIDHMGRNDLVVMRNAMLRTSLEKAWAAMGMLQGPDPAKWSWGQLHQIHFRHPLDQMPSAAAITDLEPVPRPGDEYTVNATGYPENSFDQTSGASYREIIDLSDWDHSVAVNVPGQSGQPGSPHYSDLLPLWSEGKYFPLVYSRDAVQKEVTDTLILKP
jgi:penicillin G amidase